MAQSPLNSRRPSDITESNQREWSLRARMISRENTRSRRFSASYIASLREDSRSFRSNFTISSTASSPGYNLKEEIDPSTYSFTSALRALQARSVNTWECLSPEGFALNSKWNDAEKYICNPLSGEVPMECLSAKTLSGRSFRNLTNRFTMSAPLIYPTHSRFNQTTNPCYDQEAKIHNVINEMKAGNMFTRDVGVQSTSPDLTSINSATSPASSSLMDKTSSKSNAAGEPNSPNSSPKSNLEQQEVKVKETVDDKEETKTVEVSEKTMEKKKISIGCLPMRSCLWRRKQEKEYKHIPRKQKKNIFPLPC